MFLILGRGVILVVGHSFSLIYDDVVGLSLGLLCLEEHSLSFRTTLSMKILGLGLIGETNL